MNTRVEERHNEPSLLELTGITRVFGQGESAVHALRGVDISISRGEFVAIMGSSGSGKSTCMNIIGGLDRATSGVYHFEGVKVGQLTRDQLARLRRYYLGFIFQGFNLLARTSALENVELPLLYRGVPLQERRRKSLKTLYDVGLKGREHHTAVELSGGQQQRVAIARAIVTNPTVLLADEPTGNLDTKTSIEIMNLLEGLNRDRGITILMVTHEDQMAAYAHRVINFVDGRVDTDHLNGAVA